MHTNTHMCTHVCKHTHKYIETQYKADCAIEKLEERQELSAATEFTVSLHMNKRCKGRAWE